MIKAGESVLRLIVCLTAHLCGTEVSAINLLCQHEKGRERRVTKEEIDENGETRKNRKD